MKITINAQCVFVLQVVMFCWQHVFITSNNFQHIYDYTLDKLCRHKKGNCCQKLGIRSGRPRKTHAILRLACCPVSMGFLATFQNSPQLPRIHLKIGLKHVVSYLRIIYLLQSCGYLGDFWSFAFNVVWIRSISVSFLICTSGNVWISHYHS